MISNSVVRIQVEPEAKAARIGIDDWRQTLTVTFERNFHFNAQPKTCNNSFSSTPNSLLRSTALRFRRGLRTAA